MADIEIKQGVEKIADGEISKADAAFIKGQIDVINQDKTKNHFQEFIKTNKVVYENTKNCINESLQKYLTSGQCEDANIPVVQDFINRLHNEYNKEITPAVVTPEKPKSYEPVYKEGLPLESMVTNLNTILPVDKKLPEAEVMRTNMRSNIMKQIEKALDNNLKDRGKMGALKEEMKKWFNNELTDKRISNLITGSMYVTIHNIDKQIKAPNAATIDNFNLVGINILKDIKDINSLLTTNGSWLKNILIKVEDKISVRIKEEFKKSEFILKSEEAFRQKLDGMNNARGINPSNPESINFEATTDNPVTILFNNDIIIDTEKDVINLIQDNSSVKEPINPEEIATPQKIQENLYKKANEIMSSIPLDPHEREAFKTGLMQNKIGGWPKDIVKGFFDLIKGTKLFNLFKGLFGNTLDKLFLSKSRNDAKEGALHYADLKKNEPDTFKTTDIDKQRSQNINADFNKIQETVSSNGLYYTLTRARKYIYPDSKTTTDHKNKFIDGNNYDPKNIVYNNEKISTEFNKYVAEVNKNWSSPVTERIVDEKGKDATEGTKVTYTYADIIKSESDLIEHFFNYVQTGEYPHNYSDKSMFEDLKAPWAKPKAPSTPTNTTPDPTKNIVDPTKTTPATPEVIPEASAVKKAAQDYATKIGGKVEVSQIWADSFFVRNKKGEAIMFKPANPKKIVK